MSITLVFLVLTVGISLYGFNNVGFQYKMTNHPYSVVRNNEYYRLLTSGFVHGGYLHLFLNMYVLYMFGENMEHVFNANFGQQGKIYFFGLYVGGIIFSSIPDIIRHKNNPNYYSLGASGGVASVLFACILFMPTSKLMIFPIPVEIPAYIFAIIYVAYSVYMDKKQMDNIGHMAHLWGALWGVVFIMLFFPGIHQHFVREILQSWGR